MTSTKRPSSKLSQTEQDEALIQSNRVTDHGANTEKPNSLSFGDIQLRQLGRSRVGSHGTEHSHEQMSEPVNNK